MDLLLPVNPFVAVLRTAAAKGWCVQPNCGTCGARDYRLALRELGGPPYQTLADALAVLKPSEITWFAERDWALEVAVRGLPLPLIENVLGSWSRRIGENIRFDDVVLYRIVRFLPADNATRGRWIAQLVPIGIRQKDLSLVESLLLTLRHSANQYPDLVIAATTLGANSPQMRRVLRNAVP